MQHETTSIDISKLKKDLRYEPEKLKTKTIELTDNVRNINQNYINSLSVELENVRKLSSELMQEEERIRKENKVLLTEHAFKQKTQEALVQLLM